METLKEKRKNKNITQREAAQRLGVSLRSYISYENDSQKENTPKYRFLLRELDAINRIDEEHGVLSIKEITEKCKEVLSQYSVSYCFLFGSYAKSSAKEGSDIDLLVSADVKGLQFYEMTEKLREVLHKKVDVLTTKQLVENETLIDEILKTGIKIYG